MTGVPMFKENIVRDLEKLKRRQLFRSTLLLLILIGVVEMSVMFLVHPLVVSDLTEAVIDAVLLVLILLPFIYLLFIKPVVSETEHSLNDSLQVSDDLVRAMPAGIYIYSFQRVRERLSPRLSK